MVVRFGLTKASQQNGLEKIIAIALLSAPNLGIDTGMGMNT